MGWAWDGYGLDLGPGWKTLASAFASAGGKNVAGKCVLTSLIKRQCRQIRAYF